MRANLRCGKRDITCRPWRSVAVLFEPRPGLAALRNPALLARPGYAIPGVPVRLDVRPGQSSPDLNTIIFSICISAMVWGMPPTPIPDWRRPAKGIQSTRKAVKSLTMTAEASSRR